VTPGRREHYSYSYYADPTTATSFDERRFGGPIGELVAADQAAVLARFVGPLPGRSILDVGTGTGRAALLLARGGARVTGIDASEQMLAVARQRAAQANVPVQFQSGDAHGLAFPDRAFDVAISLRVLMHTPDWPRAIAELCRVSRDRVVFDYPSARSAALLQSMARAVLHRLGVRTEPYRVFSDRAIDGALAAAGFRVVDRHRQFVLPIAVHKAIGSRSFTEASERLLQRAGLLALAGSPVTLLAERCARS
jgi:2-polyprenyl-3-methyl-5-hydroxy-6-metoxy-1,4-benzoquinol methylase